MPNCCDDYGNCRQGRDCPVRVERVRQAKERIEGGSPNMPILLLGRLALAAVILAIIFIVAMYRDALRVAS